MPPFVLPQLERLEPVEEAGATDRDAAGRITGYVLVTTDGVVWWHRWRPESREWELVERRPVGEVAGVP